MLEDYIKEIVKEEIAKDNLNKQYGKNSQPIYKVFGDHFNHFTFLTSSNDIRNLLDKLFEDKKNKNCLYFHFFKDDVAMCSISAHKAWNTKFGELVDELEIKSNRFIITKKTGGIDIEKQKLKQENEKLKQENEKLHGIATNKERISKRLNSMLNKEKRKNKELKQENVNLQSKVSDYYNKFLSEGIRKEKAQELIRSIEKEIDSQGFDQDDFFSPEQTFYRIKNILKES